MNVNHFDSIIVIIMI